MHLRSVLGNLNICFGLLALEICALQARLVCSIFSRINRLCYRRLSGISSQYSCGEKVIQCHYRKLTGESDIGVRAPLPLSGRASFLCCSLAEMASPMALPSSAMPVLCSVGLLLGDTRTIRTPSPSHSFPRIIRVHQCGVVCTQFQCETMLLCAICYLSKS